MLVHEQANGDVKSLFITPIPACYSDNLSRIVRHRNKEFGLDVRDDRTSDKSLVWNTITSSSDVFSVNVTDTWFFIGRIGSEAAVCYSPALIEGLPSVYLMTERRVGRIWSGNA